MRKLKIHGTQTGDNGFSKVWKFFPPGFPGGFAPLSARGLINRKPPRLRSGLERLCPGDRPLLGGGQLLGKNRHLIA
jgi:hypothetical protein